MRNNKLKKSIATMVMGATMVSALGSMAFAANNSSHCNHPNLFSGEGFFSVPTEKSFLVCAKCDKFFDIEKKNGKYQELSLIEIFGKNYDYAKEIGEFEYGLSEGYADCWDNYKTRE